MGHDQNRENDPFYFSDTIRAIDEEAPFIRLRLFQQLKCPVAILCIDAISGEESLYAGYVKNTNFDVLEIENPNELQSVIKMTDADFYPLERKDAPAELQAITTEAYSVGMRFCTPKSTGYLLVHRDA